MTLFLFKNKKTKKNINGDLNEIVLTSFNQQKECSVPLPFSLTLYYVWRVYNGLQMYQKNSFQMLSKRWFIKVYDHKYYYKKSSGNMVIKIEE